MNQTPSSSARQPSSIDRRTWLLALAALPFAAGAQPGQPTAPVPMTERGGAAITALLAGRTPTEGRVTLDVPQLAENGLSVPLRVAVESPMSEVDHVHTVHIIAPSNPTPTVARLFFGPRSGSVDVRTRIRLADSQTVLAFAEMSDGSVWLGRAPVVVTLGGCVDPVL